MKRLFLLSIALFLISEIGQGQCKYNTSIKGSKKYSVSESRPKVEIATQFNTWCRRGVTALGYAYSKTDSNDYYLFINVSTFGQVIEIHESNEIIIEFDDKSKITLLPNGNYTGLLSGAANFAIGAFYKIIPEQLKKFSNNSVTYVKVYYNPGPPSSSPQSDDRTYYHDFKIKKNKRFEKFKEMANCILNYK